jgi:small subunit ribosomal protein S21
MRKHWIGPFDNKKGLSVDVRNNNIEGAIRTLGRKIKQEGLIREIRSREFYENKSTVRRRERGEAISRALKANKAKVD